ncbi:MAG: hypothetical protein LBF60_02055 [Treponema sp.]|nr:hypothetical protein [Treponema sp.]
MKNIVRLLFFFCCAFMLVLFFFTLIGFFRVRSAGLTTIAISGSFLREFVLSFCGRLPQTLYLTILISLSYAARREISCPVSMFCVFIFAMGFIALGWLFIAKTGEIRLPPASEKTITFGEKGLILFSSGGSNESIALLDGPQEYPRVVVFPDAQAEYQRTREESAADAPRAAPPVKPLFFRNDESAFMARIMDKFHIAALKFEELAANGPRNFMLYAASLILLLVSVRFIMNISSWHFANLLFGGLFFSGILYLEAFVDSIQAQNLISTAIKGIIPKNYISPAVFCLAALLFISIAIFFHALSKRTQEKEMRHA